MLSDDELAELKSALEAKLAELNALETSTKEARRPVELDQQSVGRLSRMDAMQQQAMALATEKRRYLERQKVEAALARMAGGDYGECTNCGEDIALARLRLDPAIALCLPCMRGGE